MFNQIIKFNGESQKAEVKKGFSLKEIMYE